MMHRDGLATESLWRSTEDQRSVTALRRELPITPERMGTYAFGAVTR